MTALLESATYYFSLIVNDSFFRPVFYEILPVSHGKGTTCSRLIKSSSLLSGKRLYVTTLRYHNDYFTVYGALLVYQVLHR